VPLPIDDVLDDVVSALAGGSVAILRAPPGAGKTTRLPLVLLRAQWLRDRRIILLEPRRLAARAAAARMAASLGEPVGRTVGHRMRMDTRVSADTRIEVVTEGVLTRMLQHDPSLEGVGLVIFDEFHERSIHADVGLALTLHARMLFRPDLRLLIMSATLDTARISEVLNGPAVITSEGRQWPVDTHYLDRPVDGFVDDATAAMALRNLGMHDGDILVFLPGAAEIRRAEAFLRGRVDPDVDVFGLFGQLPQAIQDRAIAPSPTGRRKIVLATSIAQTSLTIEGIRVVVDSGLMRVPRFSPRTGMTRLETVRVSRATAEQRRGRAGRTAAGVCYRMWTKAEDAGLVPHDAPEILQADLTPLALDLASWGIENAGDLAWIDEPPRPALQQARSLLTDLHALDAGRITQHGQRITDMGLHPRLAHMVLTASTIEQPHLGAAACVVSALLAERDVLRGSRDPDFRLRIDALRRNDRSGPVDEATRQRVLSEAARLATHTGISGDHRALSTLAHASDNAGLLLALAYPDRVAQRRSDGRFLMRNGRGVMCDAPSLTNEFIVVAEMDDSGRDARVYHAAPISRDEIESLFHTDIELHTVIEWDDPSDSARAYRVRTLGAIVLERVRVTSPDPQIEQRLLIAAIRRKGIALLPWDSTTASLRLRAQFARRYLPDALPDLSDDALNERLDDWLTPFLQGARRLSDITPSLLHDAVRTLFTFEQLRQIDSFAPHEFTAPTGTAVVIDYSNPNAPSAAVRLQEMFGIAKSPTVGGGRVPVTLHLLSPARRPIQVTSDLDGFWKGSYFEVRKEMRGRYPKHDWPLDPLSAAPTRKARPRGDRT
jgi:ATP-dependent helicase HrpB